MSTAGTTSAATGFVGRNSRLGKKSWHTTRRQGFRHVSRHPHRGSGKLAYDPRRRPWIGESVTTYSDGSPSSVQTTDFAYDGNQIALQFDKDGTGNVTSTDMSRRYLSGPAVDQVLADEQLTPLPGGYDLTTPGNVVWTLTDQENTLRDLAVYNPQTHQTTVVNHLDYSPFGQNLSQTNPATDGAATVTCEFAYAGRPTDTATGLENDRARIYDAALMRFISEDPTSLTAGDTNVSRYCGNDPVNATDPSGLQSAPSAPTPVPVQTLLDDLRKSPLGQSLYEQAMKANGGNAPTIEYGATGGFGGRTNLNTGTISLDPSETAYATALETLVFELENLAHKDRFDQFAKQASLGDMNEEQFVNAMEGAEFANSKQALVVWNSLRKSLPQVTVGHMPTLDFAAKEPLFKNYYERALDRHKQVYREAWWTRYSQQHFQKYPVPHPKPPDPNQPAGGTGERGRNCVPLAPPVLRAGWVVLVGGICYNAAMSTAGTTSAATGFVGRNSRLGKKSWHTTRRQGFRHVSRHPHRGSGKLACDRRRRPWIGETVTTYSDGSPSSVHTTDFVYDGNQIVLQFDKDGAGNVTANDLSHRYLYGPAVDQVLADERVTVQNGTLATDEVLWPLADAQGTVRDVALLSGTTTAVVDHVIYNSFGGVVNESDPSQGCLFKYTGCPTDPATDIEFHYERPKIAGSVDWLKVDQSSYTSGTTNLYGYCGESPTNFTDPSGLQRRGPGAAGRPPFFPSVPDPVRRDVARALGRPDDSSVLQLFMYIVGHQWELQDEPTLQKMQDKVLALFKKYPEQVPAAKAFLRTVVSGQPYTDSITLKLLDNYLSPVPADPLKLTVADMQQMTAGPKHLDLGGRISITRAPGWSDAKQKVVDTGKSVPFVGTFTADWADGGVGSFTVHYDGYIAPVTSGGAVTAVKFVGKVWFTGRFEFEPNWKWTTGKQGGQRSALGERRTRIAWVLGLGKDFNWTSVVAPASQSVGVKSEGQPWLVIGQISPGEVTNPPQF